MNYLTHLFLSQRTPLSMVGNLMGDFKPGVNAEQLPQAVQLGIKNHRFVDKITDAEPAVKQLKTEFSAKRRRYAGIILDIGFDYFLIKHWLTFEHEAFDVFEQNCYQGLLLHLDLMPDRMCFVIENMAKHNWLSHYATLDGVSDSIDQVAKRMRFKNDLSGGVEELRNNYINIEQGFLTLFPMLVDAVAAQAIEKP